MRRRAYVFLLIMLTINALAFWFEPEEKTILNAILYSAFVVATTFIFYRLALGREMDEV